MTLEALKEELKQQIEEAQKREGLEPDEQEDATEEVAKEEEPANEQKAEAEPEQEAKPEKTPEEYRRERREKADLKRQMEEQRLDYERRLKEMEEKYAPRQDEQQEEEVANPEVAQLIEERRIERAAREFIALEDEFKQTVPDYKEVTEQYAGALVNSIRIQNPTLKQSEATEIARLTILQNAGKFAVQKLNPVEELYHLAKEMGFGKQAQAQEPEAKEEPKPNMAKVAANRARSAGTAAGTGESRGQMTKQAAADLTAAEWAKLPASEKHRLIHS